MVLGTRHAADRDRVALVLPGLTYTPARPLLHFLARALHGRGWTVQEVWWNPPAEDGLRQEYVERQARAALEREEARNILVVAKCLGTRFLPEAARRGLAGIWLTPMLDIPAVATAVRRSSAPSLLVGGTADPHWTPAAIRASSGEILELPGADHGLEIPGDVCGSLNVLATVVQATEEFAETAAPG